MKKCSDCKHWKRYGWSHHKCLLKPKGYCSIIDEQDYTKCSRERGAFGECGPEGKNFQKANFLIRLFR